MRYKRCQRSLGISIKPFKMRSFYLILLIFIILISTPSLFLLDNSDPLIDSALAEVEREALGTGPGRFNSVVAEDIDDDGRCEIVFGNYEGYVVVLEYRDYDFHEVWRSKKTGHRMWGITVGDFMGDDTKEIIAGNGDGELYIYDAKTHKKLWDSKDEYPELVRDVHGLLLHDLGQGGKPYLLAGTGYKNDKNLGTVYIFKENESTAKPEMVSKIGPFDNRLRGIGVGDVDKDGQLEIVVGSGVSTGERPGEGYIRIFDVKSALDPNTMKMKDSIEPEWKSKDLKGCCVAVELADFTGDGNPDIVVGNGYRYDSGWVRILTYDSDSKNYKEYWKSPDIGPKPYGLTVGDVDGDDNLDIVVGNLPGYIFIYEQSGSKIKQVWRSEVLGTDIFGMDIADVDKDGQIEIIASQGGYIGKGDYTSAYSDPHIYIIDGKTHEIEIIIGETHPLGFILQVTILILFILLLLCLNYYLRYRKKVKILIESQERSSTTKGKPISDSTPALQSIHPAPTPTATPQVAQPSAPRATPIQPPIQPKQIPQAKPSQTSPSLTQPQPKSPPTPAPEPPPQVFDPFQKHEEVD